MELAVVGSTGDLGKAKGAEVGSIGPLSCEPGWEVAHPLLFRHTTGVNLRAIQGHWNDTGASPF